MSTQEQAEVMLAYVGGAKIQQRTRDSDWELTESPSWNWDEYRYRVADNLGYFVIRTDAKPYKVFDTLKQAQNKLPEWQSRHPDARIVECVEKMP